MIGDNKTGGWFLHAMTADEWLMTLKFRVHRNSFQQDALAEQLNLKPLDDIDELPVYGRTSRVRVRNLKGPWQEISITVHWLTEIDTPGFWQFLADARDAFLTQANKAKLNPADLTPWKVLGRKWHLTRKGFPSGKRVGWQPELLDKLFDVLESVLPDGEIDWANKQVVYFYRQGDAKAWAAVHTKRRGGIDLSLFAEPDQMALGRIAGFGKDREITPHRDGREAAKIRFTAMKQATSRSLKTFLEEQARAD